MQHENCLKVKADVTFTGGGEFTCELCSNLRHLLRLCSLWKSEVLFLHVHDNRRKDTFLFTTDLD
jgi:hypothetical protein